MPDFTLVGPIPRHTYCFVDRSFTRKDGSGFEPAVWFGLVSYPGRAWGLTVMLECGAVYRALPPHAIAFVENPIAESDAEIHAEPWMVWDAQRWDCYGLRYAVVEYPYLTGLRLRTRDNGKPEIDWLGDYLFTVAPIGDGFSAEPSQAKEFTFCRLDNGRLTIQPTNHVLFEEKSFTTDSGWPTDLVRQTEIYSCEE